MCIAYTISTTASYKQQLYGAVSVREDVFIYCWCFVIAQGCTTGHNFLFKASHCLIE